MFYVDQNSHSKCPKPLAIVISQAIPMSDRLKTMENVKTALEHQEETKSRPVPKMLNGLKNCAVQMNAPTKCAKSTKAWFRIICCLNKRPNRWKPKLKPETMKLCAWVNCTKVAKTWTNLIWSTIKKRTKKLFANCSLRSISWTKRTTEFKPNLTTSPKIKLSPIRLINTEEK